MSQFIEFERKFLIRAEALADLLASAYKSQEFHQGYFMADDQKCVRVRRAGDDFLLTFKSSTGEVGKAFEDEMAITPERGMRLLAQCETAVQKRRYYVKRGEFTWEVDVFAGHNAGLVLAEVELDSDAASLRLSGELPSFVEREVTGDARYFNTELAKPKVGRSFAIESPASA